MRAWARWLGLCCLAHQLGLVEDVARGSSLGLHLFTSILECCHGNKFVAAMDRSIGAFATRTGAGDFVNGAREDSWIPPTLSG
jgi:hypothetical protein